jgi:ABC-type transporter Mla MlaB component
MQSVNDSYTFILEGNLTTSESTKVHAAVLGALENHSSVVIDCTRADEIDVSFLQILIAASSTAAASHKHIRLASPPSGVLLKVLQRCGFPNPEPNTTSLAELLLLPSRGQ